MSSSEPTATVSTLPTSLAREPNVPLHEQTDVQLAEERAYWQEKIDVATGWGAAYGFALSQRVNCDAEIKRRQGIEGGR